MKDYTSEMIRNVALLGHGGCGKTTFLEAALLATGVITRLGKVEDGSTVSDYDKMCIRDSGNCAQQRVIKPCFVARMVHYIGIVARQQLRKYLHQYDLLAVGNGGMRGKKQSADDCDRSGCHAADIGCLLSTSRPEIRSAVLRVCQRRASVSARCSMC